MDGDLVTVVVLGYLDVPGYASYLPGDVAGFEKSVAEALIQQRRVRRFREVPPATPTPSANTLPEQAPKLMVANDNSRPFAQTRASGRRLVSSGAGGCGKNVSRARPGRTTTVEPRVLGQDKYRW